MDLSHYLRFVSRWWWLVLLLAGLGGAAGYRISRLEMPVYRASTTLLVIAGTPSPDLRQSLNSVQSNSLVRTYSELLLKRPVLVAVIAELGLQADPETLRGQLGVSEVDETQILVLTADDSDPARAAAIANTTVKAFNEQTAALLDNPFAANRTGLSVVEEATPPTITVGRNALIIPAVAAIIGLLLGLGIALAVEFLDTSIRSSQEVTLLTGLATVAEVPNLGRRSTKTLVTLNPAGAVESEAYRRIQLYLLPDEGEPPARSLIVTSASSSEGKSITAANLAVALAQSGMRTVLIDANLHRPTIHELFHTTNTQGLTTLLRRDTREQAYDATIESGVENLRLLVSGPASDLALTGKLRLLLPRRIGSVIRELQQQADIVIFDAPPLLDVFETSLLARSCDAVLLVVRAKRTQAPTLLRATELLTRMRARALGVVLNAVPRAALGRSAGYHLGKHQLIAAVKDRNHAALPGGSRSIVQVSPIARGDREG
jgi:capsular exopolysaccharide synthesis family protein